MQVKSYIHFQNFPFLSHSFHIACSRSFSRMFVILPRTWIILKVLFSGPQTVFFFQKQSVFLLKSNLDFFFFFFNLTALIGRKVASIFILLKYFPWSNLALFVEHGSFLIKRPSECSAGKCRYAYIPCLSQLKTVKYSHLCCQCSSCRHDLI